ncbi:hypothetical protein D8674_031354 [Pyrus ussuriensis x Pyrus communis]|uniref:Uncharacterized protein n=1 Tax=Pyrus ussuriensis x Pyrus communis TaxID=2448454 RepID=A0A5N5FBM1_9ROSA|nr:hypothetical protein D8674_031354 [Pyrus ussuriensis x Pyrus communis]
MKLFARLIYGSRKIVSRVFLKQVKAFGLVRLKSTMSTTKAPLHRTLKTTNVVLHDGKNIFIQECQAEQLYMDDMKKPFTHQGC